MSEHSKEPTVATHRLARLLRRLGVPRQLRSSGSFRSAGVTRILAASVAGLMLLGAGSVVGNTVAAWQDPAVFKAQVGAGTWSGGGSDSPGGPVVSGSADVVIGNTSWTITNATSSIQACSAVQVTTTSNSEVAWKILIVTTESPWNGATSGYSQNGDGYDWSFNTPSAGYIQVSGGYKDNQKISATHPRTVTVCNYGLQPAPVKSANYTVSTSHGAWDSSRACMVTTVTGTGVEPFYFNWSIPLDLQPAFAKIESYSGHQATSVRVDGSFPGTFSPSLSTSTMTYTAASATASAIRGTGSYSFTTCVHYQS